VLAIDTDEKSIQSVAPQINSRVQWTPLMNSAARTGRGNFDIAIVTINEMRPVSCPPCSCGGWGTYIISRASDELHGSILRKIGADKVVYPEQKWARASPMY